MNWGRAKSMFIVAFLILNSFLFYQLWEKRTNKLEFTQFVESSLDELLMLKQIRLEAEVGEEPATMSQLNAQFLTHSYDPYIQLDRQRIMTERNLLISELTSPVPVPYPWNEEKFNEDILFPLVLRGSEYTYDRHSEQGIVYVQQIEEYPNFVGRLVFTVNEMGQVTGYEQFYYHVINQGTEQPVISPYSIIRTLIDNQIIPANSVITEVEVGYYSHIYEIDSQVLNPVWRIVLEIGGREYMIFVNAFTGATESEPIR